MYSLIVAGAVLGVLIYIYNQLIRNRFLVREAFSGIDVQLKRRHDLIPSLVETVKGYMQHERKLLEEIARLRTRVMSTQSLKEKGELENNLSQTLKSIFVLVENYPNLKANENFLMLQKDLTEIEDALQLARRYYNGTVRNYNIMAQSFPNNLVAGMFNFKLEEFFEIEYATDRQVPDVKFESA